MKKFLTKKATMIGSIVAAAVVFILLLAFCVRPVSVGYTYKYSKDDITTKIHINSFNKVTMTMEYKGESEDMEGYYFVKDGILIFVDAENKEDFKDQKESYLENWDKDAMEEYGMKINAFKITMGDESATCGGAYATVVVLAIVDAILVAGAVASIVLSRKK